MNVNTQGDYAPVTEEMGVRLPLLALLAKEPAHGYELKQALELTFGAAYPSPNIGQIYVTLGRLEKDGLVRAVAVEQSNRPNKKVYYLTEDGREALTTWADGIVEGPRVRDEFFMKLVLAPMTGIADRSALIGRQTRHFLGIMRDLHHLAETTPPEDRFAHLLIEGAMLHLQADLDWLERCREELT
ncbi:PadR family transcriptional regulator [Sinosporangium album]|uniref:PadR family transcriptional regulator n=1 Tax=Sinosporangium album TaxID=504805 RepID=UPI001FE2202F|nr:PadR family transcriptional regulator [Sinosporangium album]